MDQRAIEKGLQQALSDSYCKGLHPAYDDEMGDGFPVYGGYDYAELAVQLVRQGWTPPSSEVVSRGGDGDPDHLLGTGS